MGYYTYYTLEVENIGGNKDYDTGVSLYDDDESFIEGRLDQKYLFKNDTKWYEHSDDMRKLSKNYPGVLFTLVGEGEEAGDLWRKYYYDGKEQVANARIEFDEFDLSKLV